MGTSDIIIGILGVIFIIGVIYGAIKHHKSGKITIFYSYIDFSVAFGISTIGLIYYFMAQRNLSGFSLIIFSKI